MIWQGQLDTANVTIKNKSPASPDGKHCTQMAIGKTKAYYSCKTVATLDTYGTDIYEYDGTNNTVFISGTGVGLTAVGGTFMSFSNDGTKLVFNSGNSVYWKSLSVSDPNAAVTLIGTNVTMAALYYDDTEMAYLNSANSNKPYRRSLSDPTGTGTLIYDASNGALNANGKILVLPDENVAFTIASGGNVGTRIKSSRLPITNVSDPGTAYVTPATIMYMPSITNDGRVVYQQNNTIAESMSAWVKSLTGTEIGTQFHSTSGSVVSYGSVGPRQTFGFGSDGSVYTVPTSGASTVRRYSPLGNGTYSYSNITYPKTLKQSVIQFSGTGFVFIDQTATKHNETPISSLESGSPTISNSGTLMSISTYSSGGTQVGYDFNFFENGSMTYNFYHPATADNNKLFVSTSDGLYKLSGNEETQADTEYINAYDVSDDGTKMAYGTAYNSGGIWYSRLYSKNNEGSWISPITPLGASELNRSNSYEQMRFCQTGGTSFVTGAGNELYSVSFSGVYTQLSPGQTYANGYLGVIPGTKLVIYQYFDGMSMQYYSKNYDDLSVGTKVMPKANNPMKVRFSNDGTNMYYQDFDSGNVYKKPLSGGSFSNSSVGTSLLNVGASEPYWSFDISSDEQFIFHNGTSGNSIYKAKSDGSDFPGAVFSSGSTRPYNVIYMSGSVYFDDGANVRKHLATSTNPGESVIVAKNLKGTFWDYYGYGSALWKCYDGKNLLLSTNGAEQEGSPTQYFNRTWNYEEKGRTADYYKGTLIYTSAVRSNAVNATFPSLKFNESNEIVFFNGDRLSKIPGNGGSITDLGYIGTLMVTTVNVGSQILPYGGNVYIRTGYAPTGGNPIYTMSGGYLSWLGKGVYANVPAFVSQNTKPSISSLSGNGIVNPSNAGIYGITVNGITEDEGGGTDVYYKLDGDSDWTNAGNVGTGTVSNGTFGFNLNLSGRDDGLITVYVKVRDPFTDSNTLSMDLTKDTGVLTLTEVTPISPLASNRSPSYTFNSTKTGSIVYGGACGTGSVLTAIPGNNSITYSNVPYGTYSDCTITVTDIIGQTETLNVSPFQVVDMPVSITDFAVDEDAPMSFSGSDSKPTIGFDVYTDLSGVPVSGTFSGISVTITNSGSDTETEFRIWDESASSWSSWMNASQTGTIDSNDRIQLKRRISSTPGTEQRTVVTILGPIPLTANFTTIALDLDRVIDPISFSAKNGQALSANVESDAVSISGLSEGVELSVTATGGMVSVNSGSYSLTGTIKNGDSVKVRMASADSESETKSMTLSVSSNADVTFSVTTLTPDYGTYVPPFLNGTVDTFLDNGDSVREISFKHEFVETKPTNYVQEQQTQLVKMLTFREVVLQIDDPVKGIRGVTLKSKSSDVFKRMEAVKPAELTLKPGTEFQSDTFLMNKFKKTLVDYSLK